MPLQLSNVGQGHENSRSRGTASRLPGRMQHPRAGSPRPPPTRHTGAVQYIDPAVPRRQLEQLKSTGSGRRPAKGAQRVPGTVIYDFGMVNSLRISAYCKVCHFDGRLFQWCGGHPARRAPATPNARPCAGRKSAPQSSTRRRVSPVSPLYRCSCKPAPPALLLLHRRRFPNCSRQPVILMQRRQHKPAIAWVAPFAPCERRAMISCFGQCRLMK
jgi:hypothetical protein